MSRPPSPPLDRRLPLPAAAAAWLENTGAGRSERDRDLLDRAVRTLLGNLTPPEAPWAPLRGIRPSPTHYRGVWNWDAAFHAVAVVRWDPVLAREQFEILRRSQGDDGMYVDVWFEDGGRVDAFSKPPVWAWAVARLDEVAPDAAFRASAYDSLVRNQAFWHRERRDAATGLFFYGGDAPKAAACICCKPETPVAERLEFHARLESGWDTSPRWDGDAHDLWAIDLNSYQVMAFHALASLAQRQGRDAEAADWMARATALAAAIEQYLWDPRLGMYSDVHRHTRRPTGVLTPASFSPLLAGTASPERAARMAALAADPMKLFPGLPSVAYDHPAFERRDYWRGPTWLNVAALAVAGLRRYEHHALADELRGTLLRWLDAHHDSLCEHYDARTGEGLRAQHFGWTAAFAIELLLDGAQREGGAPVP